MSTNPESENQESEQDSGPVVIAPQGFTLGLTTDDDQEAEG